MEVMEVIDLESCVKGSLRRFSAIAGDDMAYIIFTSGSSGKPKGVKVKHKAVQNTCREMVALLKLTKDDVCFGLSALSFDLSVFDIFGPLSVGGKLVLCGAQDTQNPHVWKAILRKHQVTIWNSVPKSFQMLTQYEEGGDLHWPRTVLLSGDWVPVQLARETYNKCRLICLGGATEASTWSNFHEVVEEPHPDQISIPYGRALPNQQMMVLDQDLQKVPDGQEGEIYIGGEGLACGYFKDPERTKDVFLHSPFYGPLYKTGDFGRYLETGEIEFLGRRDSQIQRSGFRVELNQISSEVEQLHFVASAVATHKDTGDGVCVTCWVELKPSYWNLMEEQEAHQLVKHQLDSKLPQHFQPDEIIFQKLPLSSNGKVDYGKLRSPEPQECKKPQAHNSGFITECEEWLLKEIWPAGCDGPGSCKENFIQSGIVNSRKAIAVAKAASLKFRTNVEATDFYKHPSVEKLALLIEKRRKEPVPAVDACECSVPVQVPLPQAQPMRLGIVAMALRSPRHVRDPGTFFQSLADGIDQVGPVPPERISLGLCPRQAGLPGCIQCRRNFANAA